MHPRLTRYKINKILLHESISLLYYLPARLSIFDRRLAARVVFIRESRDYPGSSGVFLAWVLASLTHTLRHL